MYNSRATPAQDQSAGSRLLYTVDRWTGRPLVALAVVAADIVWVLFSVFNGFPSRLETVFQAVVAALTLGMVFVIQHTQARHQVTTQRKLDEILRALPHADNSMIALEDAADEILRTTHEAQRDLRREALGHAG